MEIVKQLFIVFPSKQNILFQIPFHFLKNPLNEIPYQTEVPCNNYVLNNLSLNLIRKLLEKLDKLKRNAAFAFKHIQKDSVILEVVEIVVILFV